MEVVKMIAISDTELHQAFQREYPKDLGHLTRTTEEESLYDFANYSEVEKFDGKKWEDIGTDLLQECFDASCFLNPQSFHYFFPAFIKQSQVDVEKTGLLVESLLRMLADNGVHWPESLKDAEAKLLAEHPEIAESLDSINEKDLSAWRQERWKLFTEQQWALIRKWLNWINQDERWEVDRDVLRRAMKNAEKWQAQRASVPHKR
jgi:hypothetical protein